MDTPTHRPRPTQMAIDLVESSKIDYLVGDLIKNKEREREFKFKPWSAVT